ncbi:MAG: hypothetical protein WC984_00390 [Bacteroidales bacterium]
MKPINLKRPSIIFAILFAIPLFFSCENNDEDEFTFYDTYIEGYIKDYHTGEPVSGVVFDAQYYNEYSGRGWFSPDPYFAKNVAVSNAQGYYKIRCPKAWKPKGGKQFDDIVMIRTYARDVEDYSFSGSTGTPNYKRYDYDKEGLKTKSVRTDMRPVTYGYLKVILPKTSNQNWGIWGNYEEETYETSYFKHQFVYNGECNDTMNYLFFKVCVLGGEIGCGNYPGVRRYFSMENPRDTVIMNIEE